MAQGVKLAFWYSCFNAKVSKHLALTLYWSPVWHTKQVFVLSGKFAQSFEISLTYLSSDNWTKSALAFPNTEFNKLFSILNISPTK